MVELAKPKIEYLSKSKNQYIDIESMNERHLINAWIPEVQSLDLCIQIMQRKRMSRVRSQRWRLSPND
jgi:hypothetical protein